VSRGFQALFVACILVASTAMFALAESRKLDRAPIKALVLSAGPRVAGKPRPAIFSPTCKCSTSYARISFRLGKPGQSLAAWIVSPDGAVVRQLANLKSARNVVLPWNGKNDAGTVVPDGSYRLRIRIAGRSRTLPVFVVVRSTRPVFSATVAPRRLTVNGDGVDDHAVVTWHSHVQLFHVRLVATHQGTEQSIPVYRHTRSYSFRWPRAVCGSNGCTANRPAAGRWTLGLAAEDIAGNAAFRSLGSVLVAKR
jgi:hypothetical protein